MNQQSLVIEATAQYKGKGAAMLARISNKMRNCAVACQASSRLPTQSDLPSCEFMVRG